MSGFDLDDFTGPWWGILQRHRLGERVDKQEIVDAIGSDYPIPDAAKPLIKAVMTKDSSSKQTRLIVGLMDTLSATLPEEWLIKWNS